MRERKKLRLEKKNDGVMADKSGDGRSFLLLALVRLVLSCPVPCVHFALQMLTLGRHCSVMWIFRYRLSEFVHWLLSSKFTMQQ